MPAATFYQPVEKVLNGQCSYEYYIQSSNSYSTTDKSRICHVRLNGESEKNKDIVLMIFTIRNQPSAIKNPVWKIHSEGPRRTDPGAVVPLRNTAVKLAKTNGWKYIAIAVAPEDAPETDIVSKYIISMESYTYGNETVYDLSNELKTLMEQGEPDFYRSDINVNGVVYSLSFIKKSKFIDYITVFDNRPYGIEDAGKKKYDVLDHNLFGIHIKEQNDALSDDRPHICIGWSKLGDLSGVSSKDELATRFVATWPDSKPKSQGQNIGQIWRFINEMQIGDYVLFADDAYLHIGKVESNYYYDETKYSTQSDDYKNTRTVVWLKKNIQRTEVSESLHRSLATGMSIWTMNDYRSAIADLLMGTYVKDETIAESEVKIDSKEQKEKFRLWMSTQRKNNGEFYSANTITSYISQMSRGYSAFDKYNDCESVFEIQSVEELAEYTNYLFNAPGFDSFDDTAGNKACSNGFVKYSQFLASKGTAVNSIRFATPFVSPMSRNRIIFGAPGTGKSFTLNKEREELIGEDNEVDYERVTFHPDYSYANFVGTYKPVPTNDGNGITYEYVPGPFMRAYVKALKNGRVDAVRPFLLIIEEINRANVSAVFGDVFQLLDRDDDGVSEYPIQASEDMKKYLAQELGGEPDDYGKIKLPDNLFVWATMNSADQGVFPMDTAFKRRWDFTYLGIDDSDKDIRGKYVMLGNGGHQKVEWNSLRKAINHFLAKEKINEDKQLGPYFISRSIVVPAKGDEIDRDSFIHTFKNKVIMYLFEDAAKQKRAKLFDSEKTRYSEICKAFDKDGIKIFNYDIQNETAPDDQPQPPDEGDN